MFVYSIYIFIPIFIFVCDIRYTYVIVYIEYLILSEVCEKMLPTYFQIFIFLLTRPFS